MQFAKPLREKVRAGTVTSSVRIWKYPRVKVGGCYAMPPVGEIEVTGLRALAREEVTDALARRTGFDSVEALLKVAKHGEGELMFLVDFVYRDLA